MGTREPEASSLDAWEAAWAGSSRACAAHGGSMGDGNQLFAATITQSQDANLVPTAETPHSASPCPCFL